MYGIIVFSLHVGASGGVLEIDFCARFVCNDVKDTWVTCRSNSIRRPTRGR